MSSRPERREEEEEEMWRREEREEEEGGEQATSRSRKRKKRERGRKQRSLFSVDRKGIVELVLLHQDTSRTRFRARERRTPIVVRSQRIEKKKERTRDDGRRRRFLGSGLGLVFRVRG